MKAQTVFVVLWLGLVSSKEIVELDFGDQIYQNRLVLAMLQAERDARESNQILQSAYNKDDSVCFQKFGCYNKLPIGSLPENPESIKPEFRLYTEDSDSPIHVYHLDSEVGNESEAVKRALSDKTKPLVFISHGFGGDGDVQWLQKIREAKTEDHNANVIVVDWKNGARLTTLYVKAAANAPLVASMAAHLCKDLVDKYDVPIEKIQFVGFSLGGQMAGYFAKEIFEMTGRKIGKITSLDAAAPLFESNGIWPRKEYTHFLEAVHTSCGNLLLLGKVGLGLSYGHVDYYPNGGVDQPGCGFLNISCAHTRAVQYYLEALANSEDCVYQGFPCDSVKQAQKGSCQAEKDLKHYMSMKQAVSDAAILYLKTNNKAPFCIKN